MRSSSASGGGPERLSGGGGRPRAVLMSWHYLGSKRKAGFHFLAEAYHGLGWQVTFVTAPISWISVLRRDPRLATPVRREARRMLEPVPGLRSFVLFTTFHAANLRAGLLNRLAAPLFRRYGDVSLGELEPEVRAADLVVFESTPALLLFDRFRTLNPAARFVYRVSDDLRLLAPHPVVLETEQRIAPSFDLVSSSSPVIHRRFAHLSNARVDGHGIDKALFDAPSASPYDGGANALFLGFWDVDRHFVATAASAFPELTFHFVGRDPGVTAGNVVAHGELPFAETVPYVQHASIGLHTVASRAAAEALADSLKVVQFSYCGLPIVAPSFLDAGRPNLVAYEPGDDVSVREAVTRALALGRLPEVRRGIPSWEELAASLAS